MCYRYVLFESGRYDYRHIISNKLPTMTANDFYRFCSIGYNANNYEYCELSPKEQYYKHAEGRDNGLSEIDPDSPEAFYEWL